MITVKFKYKTELKVFSLCDYNQLIVIADFIKAKDHKSLLSKLCIVTSVQPKTHRGDGELHVGACSGHRHLLPQHVRDL